MASRDHLNVDTSRVIDEVRLRKCLWDASDPQYKNKDARNKAWEDVADVLFENTTEENEKQNGKYLCFIVINLKYTRVLPGHTACWA